MRTILFILTLVTLALGVPPASAAENMVQIRILPEKGTIKAGEEIWIGIEKSIAPHWHTYWKNPGDSGVELRATWTLPEGFEVSEIYWPAPSKIPYPPLLNYGYEGNVILLQKLTAPENIPNGMSNLSVDIELLVCKEECIPEYGTYSLTLNAPEASNENNASYLKAALEKIPSKTDWQLSYSENETDFTLSIHADAQDLKNIRPNSLEFFPLDWGLIENPAKPTVKVTDNTLQLSQTRGERPFSDINTISGVLRYETIDGQAKAIQVSADEKPLASLAYEGAQHSSSLGLATALLFALLGGLILNLMPCVFPVLSLKALSLIKTAKKEPLKAKLNGLSYTAGVIISFLIIAGTLITLKAAGTSVGWGFHLQDPLIVSLLAYLLFVIGLNLLGTFEFTNPFANAGSKLADKDGLSGSFFTGILATLVATPCTAPFMAGALGYAITQGPVTNLLIFAALGLGLALPYLALSFIPALQKIMPRPGAWMDTFKQLLAFPMFAAAIWLIWVYTQQAGAYNIDDILIGLLLIGFAIWVLKHREKDKFPLTVLAVACLITSVLVIPSQDELSPAAMHDVEFGEEFSHEKLRSLRAENKPVFVEMTAAWCITCKVNHAIAINTDSTKKLFAEHNVKYLIGDWTNQDPEITKYLNQYGRDGVPLYVYYEPNVKDGKILPQILTPGTVKDYIAP